MHMIWAYASFYDFQPIRLAPLPQPFSQPKGYIPLQYSISIFRYPDKMVLDIVYCVCESRVENESSESSSNTPKDMEKEAG